MNQYTMNLLPSLCAAEHCLTPGIKTSALPQDALAP
jgi:hypothetical protein